MEIEFGEDGQIKQSFKPKNWQTEVIGKFLKKTIIEDKINKLNWAGQIKILNCIKKHYPEREFWLSFAETIGFKLNNLAYFLTPDGKKKLFEAHNKWKFELSLKSASEEKIDNFLDETPEKVDNKPKKIKTLMDFLK